MAGEQRGRVKDSAIRVVKFVGLFFVLLTVADGILAIAKGSDGLGRELGNYWRYDFSPLSTLFRALLIAVFVEAIEWVYPHKRQK
jgi:hypothetical protein